MSNSFTGAWMIEYVYNVRMIPTFIDFTSFFNALRIVLWVCGLEYQINNVYVYVYVYVYYTLAHNSKWSAN